MIYNLEMRWLKLAVRNIKLVIINLLQSLAAEAQAKLDHALSVVDWRPVFPINAISTPRAWQSQSVTGCIYIGYGLLLIIASSDQPSLVSQPLA